MAENRDKRRTSGSQAGDRRPGSRSTSNESDGGNTTRQRIVDSAMKLFYEQGYHATGLAEILRDANARSGSLYHFFASKEDLLLAVLDGYAEHMHAEVFEPARAMTRDPIEQVFAVMGGYRRLLESTDCTRGCPIGNLALEADDVPAVREKVAMNFDNWCAAVEEILRAAGGRFRRGTDVKALSRFVLTTMEGGIMQARAYRSLSPFDACIEQLRQHMNQLMKVRET